LRNDLANAVDEIRIVLPVGMLAVHLGDSNPIMLSRPFDGEVEVFGPPILTTLIDESDQFRC
jgi:hypothetical protein